jgi:hypothetical protein
MADTPQRKSAAKGEAPAEESQEQLAPEQVQDDPVEEVKEEPVASDSTEVRFTRDQLLNDSVMMLGTSRYVAEAALPSNKPDQRWTEAEARRLVDKLLNKKVEVDG